MRAEHRLGRVVGEQRRKTFVPYAVRTAFAGVSLGLSWHDGLMARVVGEFVLKVVGTQDLSQRSR